ncbi:MAG TPA: Hsp20/alpha crystallin family protein [Chthoniobacterales bacterium]|jgi:HSP20 family molecular chaperone IbpA
MKTKSIRYSIVSLLTLTLALPAISLAALAPSPANSPSLGNSPNTDLDRQMDQLDNRLDSVFANTFRNFGDWFGTNDFGSSIDLRDQKNKYVVRVYVPGSDTSKVNAKVENNVLHVTAQGEQQNKNASEAERYEQVISLPGPVDVSKMQIERKKNLVVINLPKSGPETASTPIAKAAATPAASANNFAAFDQSVVDKMARMQGRMDQIFRDAFPADQNLTSGFNQLGSAMHIDNQKNKYVVRFYLPDNDLKNVDVKLENGNQLRLTASENQNEKTRNATNMESGEYEQLMTLPGPVKKQGMKVERQNGTIVVTLPKA